MRGWAYLPRTSRQRASLPAGSVPSCVASRQAVGAEGLAHSPRRFQGETDLGFVEVGVDQLAERRFAVQPGDVVGHLRDLPRSQAGEGQAQVGQGGEERLLVPRGELLVHGPHQPGRLPRRLARRGQQAA